MDKFLKDLQAGEIHFRDRWQFELKSEFAPLPAISKSVHTEEFFIFIPNALLINSQTYTSDDFFKDQTNFIRYKTPSFKLHDLYDLEQQEAPLAKLRLLKDSPTEVEEELKLLANIIRSALREEVAKIILNYPEKKSVEAEQLNREVSEICTDWKKLRQALAKIYQHLQLSQGSMPAITASYIDEFLSNIADFYFVGLLKHLRFFKEEFLAPCDALICSLLMEELQIRTNYFPAYSQPIISPHGDSEILYRQSLLNKLVMDVLHLTTNRDALMHKHRNLIGSAAAGIAMLVFLLLIYSTHLFQSSEPYIILTVVLYILKDRIKEGLRAIPSVRGFGWLSNYKTEIRSPDNSKLLGTLIEFFRFIPPEEADPEIMLIRNKQFHNVLESFQRPEKIMYYKKKVSLFHPLFRKKSMLNIISRFDIHSFVSKAGDPYQHYSTFDPKNQKIVIVELPKTYHINIILKNTFTLKDLTKQTAIQKFRIIIDKNGIKDIYQL